MVLFSIGVALAITPPGDKPAEAYAFAMLAGLGGAPAAAGAETVTALAGRTKAPAVSPATTPGAGGSGVTG